jgi:hypothetical protein
LTISERIIEGRVPMINKVKHIIFDPQQGSISLQEFKRGRYCYFEVDTFNSNYDLREEARDKIQGIYKKYFIKGNLKRGSCSFGVGSTYVSCPPFIEPVYQQVLAEVLVVFNDVNNYNLITIKDVLREAAGGSK